MKPIDLKNAFPSCPEHFEARIHSTIREMERLTMMKKHKIRLVVALSLALVILAGVALAASLRWGVLDFLTARDESGKPIGGDYLQPLIQPIDLVQKTASAKITVLDSLCDGTNLTLAWTCENQSDMDLYLFKEISIHGGHYMMETTRGELDGRSLAPGGMAHCAESWNISPIAPDGEDLHVTLELTLLRSKVETVSVDLPDAIASTMSEAEWAAYYDQYSEKNLGGKLFVENGMAILPISARNDERSNAQNFMDAGLMELADHIVMDVPIQVVMQEKSALIDGQPIEKQMDGYTIRVTRADLYPNATAIDLEYVFDNEEAMLALGKSRGGWLYHENGKDVLLLFIGCYAGTFQEVVSALPGENGSPASISAYALQGFSSNTKEIYQRTDGKWVVPATQRMSPLTFAPASITIVPSAFVWTSDTENDEVQYFEDAITLTFPNE